MIAIPGRKQYFEFMDKQVTVLLVDAFTATPGKGNRAGVVLDASHLDADEMQAIAALVNVSETAFMIPAPDRNDYELAVRYFTPAVEVPSCGHATIASHFARATSLGISTGRVVAKIGAGVLPVDIVTTETGLKIVMTQGKIEFSPVCADPVRERLLAALGLRDNDLLPDLPVQEVSTGHSKVMVPIRSVQTLDALRPDMEGLKALSREIGCNGYFVFAFNGEDDPCLTSGRMFAPIAGIDEDPVTGNGNGPCGAYLYRYGRLPNEARTTYLGRQGVAMGKEGVIEVTVRGVDREPETVQVAGNAVRAGEMLVELSQDSAGGVVARMAVV